MKKIIILLASMLIICTSCNRNWFELSSDIERIGSGNVEYDNGMYFVEVDSVMYTVYEVYTNRAGSGHDKDEKSSPINGMLVTVFCLPDSPQPEFIIGNLSQEDLEDYFAKDITAFIIVIFIVLMSIVGIFFKEFWVPKLYAETEEINKRKL